MYQLIHILPPPPTDAMISHSSAGILPRDDLGPTNCPLSVPPAVIVYATSHISPLIVTVAVLLIIDEVLGLTPIKN